MYICYVFSSSSANIFPSFTEIFRSKTHTICMRPHECLFMCRYISTASIHTYMRMSLVSNICAQVPTTSITRFFHHLYSHVGKRSFRAYPVLCWLLCLYAKCANIPLLASTYISTQSPIYIYICTVVHVMLVAFVFMPEYITRGFYDAQPTNSPAHRLLSAPVHCPCCSPSLSLATV